MKWSKKICIEYLTALKDPLEEISQANALPIDKLRMELEKLRAPETTETQ